MRYQRKKTPLVNKDLNTRRWLLFDASGKTLGRFATEVCRVLRGKHSCDFCYHMDCGDGVIILNASQIKVSGSKEHQKIYRRYSGFIGGLKESIYKDVMAKDPCRIISSAVKGMMPKTKLSRHQLKRLRVFSGDCHDMQAQKPLLVNI